MCLSYRAIRLTVVTSSRKRREAPVATTYTAKNLADLASDDVASSAGSELQSQRAYFVF